jgi:GDP-4-dehydro-6-deoxy-D-mannose reductase
MERVLIFGANSFVGVYLADELVRAGYEVYGTDRQKKGESPYEGIIQDICVNASKVNYITADFLDAQQADDVVADVKPDVIVNLAAVNSVAESWKNISKTINVNISGALNILEAARKIEPIPRILFVGSGEEYCGTDEKISEDMKLGSNNPFGASTITQDMILNIYKQHYNMECNYARPFNIVGIGQKHNSSLSSFCHQVAEIEKSGKPGTVKVGNIDMLRDFIDIRDVVRAYRMILEKHDDAAIYNVGSGTGYTIRELLEHIIGFSSRKINVEIDTSLMRPVDSERIVCDNSFIRNKLGWEPIYDIKETLRDMYNYCMRTAQSAIV